jgi:hypothetical protein
MEETPPCERCAQLEREFELCERLMVEQDARKDLLEQLLRAQEARIAALEQRLLALSRRRR